MIRLSYWFCCGKNQAHLTIKGISLLLENDPPRERLVADPKVIFKSVTLVSTEKLGN